MKFLTFLATVVTAAALVGCGGTSNTANNSRANVTNLGANNASNGAIVVNSNTNMNSNTNRWNSNITRDEYEKNKADYEKEKGSSTIGQGANDMWLWVKTRASLMGADDLRESTINVDVVNDVVTLKGTVGTAAQRASAEKIAKDIDGVKSVKNDLKVAPADSMTNMSSNTNTNKR